MRVEFEIQHLVSCVINPFTMVVISAKAGIQENMYWIPHQVGMTCQPKVKKCRTHYTRMNSWIHCSPGIFQNSNHLTF